ncbi:MAG: tyrosine-protein phosphatase [Bacteroidales bacterium]|nr:tyrosine-protein phosphatase [Bacteroidales bacterium]
MSKIMVSWQISTFVSMFDSMPKQIPFLLKNQPNFRDIGGIPTMDGRSIKSGLLYRSGDLSRLDKEDIVRIEEIGIRMIIDFRSDRERINYPTPPIATVQENRRITIVDSARDTAERMLKENDVAGLETILIKDYRRMVRDHQDDFREFFRILATTENVPLIYHCAAGKDRTGLASYLLLIALGVSVEEARKDYFLSNTHLKHVLEKIIVKIKDAGNPNAEIIRPLMEVRAEYLDAALEEIELQFHSVNSFLTDILYVDLPKLRNKYLN